MKTFSVVRSVADLDATVFISHYNNILIHFKKCLYLKKGFSQLRCRKKKKQGHSQSLFQLDGCEWVGPVVGFCGRQFDLRTCDKGDAWFKHLSPVHALLNATEIVLYCASGPPQPTSNATLGARHKKKKVFNGVQYYWFRSKAILISLQGIFSNSQVINSFSQIAYSISRTWIPNKVFEFM